MAHYSPSHCVNFFLLLHLARPLLLTLLVHLQCLVVLIETTIHIVWITQLESTLGQTYRLLP